MTLAPVITRTKAARAISRRRTARRRRGRDGVAPAGRSRVIRALWVTSGSSSAAGSPRKAGRAPRESGLSGRITHRQVRHGTGQVPVATAWRKPRVEVPVSFPETKPEPVALYWAARLEDRLQGRLQPDAASPGLDPAGTDLHRLRHRGLGAGPGPGGSGAAGYLAGGGREPAGMAAILRGDCRRYPPPGHPRRTPPRGPQPTRRLSRHGPRRRAGARVGFGHRGRRGCARAVRPGHDADPGGRPGARLGSGQRHRRHRRDHRTAAAAGGVLEHLRPPGDLASAGAGDDRPVCRAARTAPRPVRGLPVDGGVERRAGPRASFWPGSVSRRARCS